MPGLAFNCSADYILSQAGPARPSIVGPAGGVVMRPRRRPWRSLSSPQYGMYAHALFAARLALGAILIPLLLLNTGPARAEHEDIRRSRLRHAARARLQPTDYRTATMAATTASATYAWCRRGRGCSAGLAGPAGPPASTERVTNSRSTRARSLANRSSGWVACGAMTRWCPRSTAYLTGGIRSFAPSPARRLRNHSHVPALAYSRRLWNYRPERQRRLVRRHHRTL